MSLGNDNINRIYEEIAESGMLIHPELFAYTNNQLNKAITKAFGDISITDDNYPILQEFRRNMARFSTYKSADQTKLLGSELKERAPEIDKIYNTNYLNAEYNHALRSANSAINWKRFEADKDIYPFLEYMPSTAADPRSDHAQLIGVIKPVDDSFWDTWMPPSDWNCQCWVQQVESDKGAVEPPADLKPPPALMRNNPGKSHKIFTDRHPMIAKFQHDYPDKIEELLKWEACGFAGKPIENITFWQSSLKTKGFAVAFDYKAMKEVPKHKDTINYLANEGKAIHLIGDVTSHKNVDAKVNGMFSEFKRVSSVTSVDTLLREANKKARYYKLSDVYLYATSSLDVVRKGIHGRIHRCRHVHNLYVIKENKMYLYNKNTKGLTEVNP
jgi:hypothetical protein